MTNGNGKNIDIIGDLFIWENTNSRGKYYTLSKKSTKKEEWNRIFLTEDEYKRLRGL